MRTVVYILLLTTMLFSVEGYEVYKNRCAQCHIETISKSDTVKKLSTLKAPPMIEVANRLKTNITIAEDDEDMHRAVVVAFIKYYVINPDILYSMCDPIAIEKFGQMPSLKGKLSEAELDAVATWIYDHFEGIGFN